MDLTELIEAARALYEGQHAGTKVPHARNYCKKCDTFQSMVYLQPTIVHIRQGDTVVKMILGKYQKVCMYCHQLAVDEEHKDEDRGGSEKGERT